MAYDRNVIEYFTQVRGSIREIAFLNFDSMSLVGWLVVVSSQLFHSLMISQWLEHSLHSYTQFHSNGEQFLSEYVVKSHKTGDKSLLCGVRGVYANVMKLLQANSELKQ